MHVFFSGIGGAGLGPLALIAHQAGYRVSGSDKQESSYVDYLRSHGIDNIHIGQTTEQIAASHAADPIDWYVYSSAVAIENPDAPELRFCYAKHIRTSKRDEFLSTILADKNLKLIAIAGTHGKTTTTAMAIWACQQLGIPISYSVGGKLSFGDMGAYDPASEYFVYEADEFDRNFLAFQPYLSIITGIDWDHHDIYPTRDSYIQAFEQFLFQSQAAVLWQEDADQLPAIDNNDYAVIPKDDPAINQNITLAGPVNRQDAWQVVVAMQHLTGLALPQITAALNRFPGVARRFEQLKPGLYSDYGHTPPKIRGTLATAHEVAHTAHGDKKLVVVYEGLHNTRQHFIKDELPDLFSGVDALYIVPTYLAREDKLLAVWTPADLKQLMNPAVQAVTVASTLDDRLKAAIQQHLAAGDLVVCLSAGGGGSLDEWLRREFS